MTTYGATLTRPETFAAVSTGHSCDAFASGACVAAHVITTRTGELQLCDHHTRKHTGAFQAAGYRISPLGEDTP